MTLTTESRNFVLIGVCVYFTCPQERTLQGSILVPLDVSGYGDICDLK